MTPLFFCLSHFSVSFIIIICGTMDYYCSSMWSYHEGIDDLKRRISYAKIELESAKMDAKEQIRKTEEDFRSIYYLVKVAQKERDEAVDLLQKLLNNTRPSSIIRMSNVLPQNTHLLPVIPTIANSSISESNILSETYNHQSSTFDSFVQDYSGSTVIDSILKGKVLPQKGKLLQAVMEVGPLLRTLFITRPMSVWQNHVPPPPLKSYVGSELVDSFARYEMTGGFSQSCSSFMLNFGESCSNSRLNISDRSVASSSCLKSQVPSVKRQKLL